jgi:hypothetical protein
MTARKPEEAKSSRMTTPMPQSGKPLVSLGTESLGQIAFARLLINQVDDDVPHGRTVVCHGIIKPPVRFRASSSDRENGFIRAATLLRSRDRTKHLHGIERLATLVDLDLIHRNC